MNPIANKINTLIVKADFSMYKGVRFFVVCNAFLMSFLRVHQVGYVITWLQICEGYVMDLGKRVSYTVLK